jgi:hypothetical protein
MGPDVVGGRLGLHAALRNRATCRQGGAAMGSARGAAQLRAVRRSVPLQSVWRGRVQLRCDQQYVTEPR